jgi:GTP-binding protein
MKIKSAKFIKGIVESDELLENEKPHIAFIGRSNVGKSSVINSLTGQKDLVRTSSTPGRTREINLFLINNSVFFVDLPGYGFTSAAGAGHERIKNLIYWYLFDSGYRQDKIVLIIDAEIFPTENDREMLNDLMQSKKDFIIVANKIDKVKKSAHQKQLKKIQDEVWPHKVIPFSSKKGIGVNALLQEILK